MSTQTTFTKDSNAVLDYAVDWSAWLDTDTISTSTWFPDPANADTVLHVDTNSKTTTVATVWLSAGTLDTDYRMTNRIVTAGGRTNDRTITVCVRAL